MNPRPQEVQALDNYRLKILFQNGELGIFDMTSLLKHKLYAPLQNEALFSTSRVSNDGMTIEWSNGIDICPDLLYNNCVKLDTE